MAALREKDGRIVRPLIALSKAEIVEVCEREGIPYRTDGSNFEEICLRNRVRLDLLPYIREGYNPRIEEGLCRLGRLAQADEVYWQEVTREAYGRIGGEEGMETAALDAMPEALKRRVVELAWREVSGGQNLAFEKVERILRLLREEKGRKTVDLGKYQAVKECGRLRFERKGEEETAPTEVFLRIGEEVDFGEWCLRLECARENAAEDAESLLLPMRAEEEGVLVRTRRDGDRIVTAGGTKKVKKVLIDRKVPQGERARLPIVCRGDEVVWICGVIKGKTVAEEGAVYRMVYAHRRK